ncbi:MAG: HU family DNA-binding protein [Lachnospirales bacterium]
MNKTELVAAIAEKTDMSKKDSEKFVKAYEEVIKEELVKGGKIQSVGFGTFEVSDRKARKGRNPSTGKEIDIPASKSVKFKVGKALKDAVN